MSRVEMHAPFKHYRGVIGDLVYKKYRGKTIVALRPEGERQASEAQSEHQQNFGQATTWARAAAKDAELGPFYKALGKKREISAYAAAMSDALKRPALKGLDLSEYDGAVGDKIYFTATDNVGLVSTLVEIADVEGNSFESGMAVEVDEGTGFWMYTARSEVPPGTAASIHVEVADRPGNFVSMTEVKEL